MSAFATQVAASLHPQILNQFGETITYKPRNGDEYELIAVLNSGEAVQQGDRVYQTAWGPLTNFTGGEPVRGDTVVISGVTYRVADIERQHFDGRLLKLAVTNP